MDQCLEAARYSHIKTCGYTTLPAGAAPVTEETVVDNNDTLATNETELTEAELVMIYAEMFNHVCCWKSFNRNNFILLCFPPDHDHNYNHDHDHNRRHQYPDYEQWPRSSNYCQDRPVWSQYQWRCYQHL